MPAGSDPPDPVRAVEPTSSSVEQTAVLPHQPQQLQHTSPAQLQDVRTAAATGLHQEQLHTHQAVHGSNSSNDLQSAHGIGPAAASAARHPSNASVSGRSDIESGSDMDAQKPEVHAFHHTHPSHLPYAPRAQSQPLAALPPSAVASSGVNGHIAVGAVHQSPHSDLSPTPPKFTNEKASAIWAARMAGIPQHAAPSCSSPSLVPGHGGEQQALPFGSGSSGGPSLLHPQQLQQHHVQQQPSGVKPHQQLLTISGAPQPASQLHATQRSDMHSSQHTQVLLPPSLPLGVTTQATHHLPHHVHSHSRIQGDVSALGRASHPTVSASGAGEEDERSGLLNHSSGHSSSNGRVSHGLGNVNNLETGDEHQALLPERSISERSAFRVLGALPAASGGAAGRYGQRDPAAAALLNGFESSSNLGGMNDDAGDDGSGGGGGGGHKKGFHSKAEQHSLQEAYASIAFPAASAPFYQKLLAFSGLGLLISIGYCDPGNWATDLAGGSQFGYALLSVVLISNCCAMVLQHLALKLGVAAERDLAQACRDAYHPYLNYVLWVLAEIAIAATDVAEVIGTAIALQLLFGLPLWAGVVVTAADVLITLAFEDKSFRFIELFVGVLTLLIAGCFFYEMVVSKPAWGDVLRGYVPTTDLLTNPQKLYISVGILGATVMPHNLYLHSSIIQTRAYPRTAEGKAMAISFGTLDSTLSLLGAFAINSCILILAAAAFHFGIPPRTDVTDISVAYELLTPSLGAKAASIMFGVALLASGQNSTITGTLSGQIVMEGFLRLRLRPWLRRLVTRGLAIIPAAAVAATTGNEGVGKLLVLSQVVLSLQLTFAVVPLVHLTSSRAHVGKFVNGLGMKILAWTLTGLIAGLNIYLVGAAIAALHDGTI